MRLVLLVQALFLSSAPFFEAPAFKPFSTATTSVIDDEAAWFLPTPFDARNTSHGFVTSTDSAPIKTAQQDGLASGHGENAGRRSLTMRLVLLVQALFLSSAPFFEAPAFKPFSTATTSVIDDEAAWFLPTPFDARNTSHGFVTSTDSAPIKTAQQDGLASGHGENAGRRSLTMRLVLLVQALFLSSAPFFEAPAFKPFSTATTSVIDDEAAWFLPTPFDARNTSHGFVTSTDSAPIKTAQQGGLASGHGENAGRRSLTMRLVLLVQALFLSSAPFFEAPAFKPFSTATTSVIDDEAAWFLPTPFDARNTSHGFVTSTDSAPIKTAQQDGLASGHGENAGRRSLTMRLVLLVQSCGHRRGACQRPAQPEVIMAVNRKEASWVSQ
ncbi:hypothetical protein MTO96_028651 [Rhipicephalus appendiculatus]